MTFLSAAQSVQDSEPRELIEISINDGTTFHRHTSASRDILYGGNTFTAIPVERGEVAVTMPGDEKDCILTLPIDHALVDRYCEQGNPPRKISVTIWRQDGGETEQIWAGEITSMNAERRVAKFRIPSRAGEWMLRPLPSTRAGRACPVFLYDSLCGVSRTGTGPTGLPHKVTTTVIYVDGNIVRVDLSTIPAGNALRPDWARDGDLKHVATGEWLTIALQTDLSPGVSTVADLTLERPIVGVNVGDSVEVYAGCDMMIGTCDAKFGNKLNFRGFPHMPEENPFTPTSYGVGGIG